MPQALRGQSAGKGKGWLRDGERLGWSGVEVRAGTQVVGGASTHYWAGCTGSKRPPKKYSISEGLSEAWEAIGGRLKSM